MLFIFRNCSNYKYYLILNIWIVFDYFIYLQPKHIQ